MSIIDGFNKYDKLARDITHSVIHDEQYQQQYLDPVPQYNDDFVKTMVVHARHDIISLVSHLSSLNKQILIIRYLLVVIFIAIVCLILRQ